MMRSVSEIVESYLSRLRAELAAVGAGDTDDLVAEVRSLLIDAAGDDPEVAEAETARLGEPAELARGILAERGLDASTGMSTGVWWRLGLAAPIDIAIGLALPAAAALPLWAVARFGQPRAASIAIAAGLGLTTLAWPFFIWRPWRRGGRTLSPGMTLTGLAVVRAPGFWRLARIDELAAMGLSPGRRIASAVVVALLAAAMLAAAVVVGVDIGGSWLASAVVSAGLSSETSGSTESLETQFQDLAEEVYDGLAESPRPETSTAAPHIVSQASGAAQALSDRIADRGIASVRVGRPRQVARDVYRFAVDEFAKDTATGAGPVGSSTFTVGRRSWARPDGTGSDWVVVDIEAGVPLISD